MQRNDDETKLVLGARVKKYEPGNKKCEVNMVNISAAISAPRKLIAMTHSLILLNIFVFVC